LEKSSALCLVQHSNRQDSEFDVQEIPTLQLRPMAYPVKLNDWWCDCGAFQAL